MIKISLDKIDDVDERYRDLYEQRDGKYVLTGVEGLRTADDVDRVQRALTNERTNHQRTKEKFKALDGLDLEDVVSKLDRYSELEAAATGKIDDTKIEEIVTTRLTSKVKPLEREIGTLRQRATDLENENQTLKRNEQRRIIVDAVRSAAGAAKIISSAIDDVVILAERMFELDEANNPVTKDGVGVTPGLSPSVWLTEMQPKRPHWWPASQGGGARGGSGGGSVNNPWSKANWNRTEQNRITNTDRARAEQLARSAGVSIGAAKPAD